MNAIPVPGDLENRVLRRAVQENLVSFPSQVPSLGKRSRADLQQRIVVLYFVSGWTMDDIARRYGLGRQRMGQILTEWRIRAVKEGYIQAIEPEHSTFKRVRLEQTSKMTGAQAGPEPIVDRAWTRPSAPASEVDKTPLAMPDVIELRGSNLAEQLHTIVGILDNQLRLCSRPLYGNIQSCEQLLARAKMLCTRLEVQVSATRNNDEGRTTMVISAAKELFQRFQEHAFEHSNTLSKPEHGQDSNHQPVKTPRPETKDRSIPPRTSQRVAARL
jgi:hypothetical protein